MGPIIILGAGPGISHGVAEKFGNEGYRIALVSRNGEKLQKQVDTLQNKKIDALYAVGDVFQKESLQKALAQVHDQTGHADMILYNASAVEVKDILEQDWDAIKRSFDANVGGAFHLLQMVLPHCLKENKGKLFFTGGGLALSGDPQWTTLSVAKAGLRNLLQAFTKRVAGTNIHIAHLMVCGYVRPEDPKYNPAAIADQYWKLFQQESGGFEHEVIY